MTARAKRGARAKSTSRRRCELSADVRARHSGASRSADAPAARRSAPARGPCRYSRSTSRARGATSDQVPLSPAGLSSEGLEALHSHWQQWRGGVGRRVIESSKSSSIRGTTCCGPPPRTCAPRASDHRGRGQDRGRRTSGAGECSRTAPCRGWRQDSAARRCVSAAIVSPGVSARSTHRRRILERGSKQRRDHARDVLRKRVGRLGRQRGDRVGDAGPQSRIRQVERAQQHRHELR